jgi:hypothetical protein
MVKGINSQDIFRGIAKFSKIFSSGLSKLQDFEVSGSRYGIGLILRASRKYVPFYVLLSVFYFYTYEVKLIY